jgi:hypothetical protein
VTPELIIVKMRNSTSNWWVLNAAIGYNYSLFLNLTDAPLNYGITLWSATSSTMTLNGDALFSVGNYVAYLFATCAGVSKVGSYTGNGTTQTINCGFTGGARFVLIRRTDIPGQWFVYDTVRGMTTLTNPYLLFNTSGMEQPTLGSVTTVSTGFALNAAILGAINANTGTYIFLAIA